MKKLLLSICFLPSIALAQKNEIGINGGFSFNTSHLDDNLYQTTYKPNLYSSLSYARKLKGFQVGARYSRHSMKVAITRPVSIKDGSSYFHPSGSIRKSAKTVQVISVFANKLWMAGRHQLYAGANGGYVSADNNGFSYGLQAGNTFFVKDWLGLNAEIGAGMYHISSGAFPTKAAFISSITFGVRFRIDKEWFAKKREESVLIKDEAVKE